MFFLQPATILMLLLSLTLTAALIYLLVLLIRALRKYLRASDQKKASSPERRTLGENIRAHRVRCGMTQEFVAESLGVSRQAVSKWESGASDPSTSNLFALARLFGVSPETLLQGTDQTKGE